MDDDHGTGWATWLTEQAAARERAGLQRSLVPRGPDDGVVDLAGNDYLGLSRHPEVAEAAAAAVKEWGVGAGASRLVTGSTRLHLDLESELADFLGQPGALVFSTGYHANLSVVSALAGRDSLVVSDAHVHASLVDAARLSRATIDVVPHHGVDEVAAALAGRSGGQRALVLVESVYSVLGDAAPLADLAVVCAENEALLVVDEAHGIGVAGAGGHGLVRELGLNGHPHVVVTATLSKSLGAQGGVVLGPPALIDHLVNRARPFIFDTGLAPAATAGALAALHHLRSHPDLAGIAAARIRGLASLLGQSAPCGAVLAVPMPSPQAGVAARDAALARGVRVGCFRPPSTPDDVSRLRITASAGLTEEEWTRASQVLVDVVGEFA